MNARSLVAAGLAASGLFLATPRANASVPGRFENQRDRIVQGWRNGSLTPAEYGRLMAGEERLHFRADIERLGGLSKWERRNMNSGFNHESRVIYRLKHN